MNLHDAFLSLDNYFSPRIIGEVNDQYIKVVKIKGQEVPWHNHENQRFTLLALAYDCGFNSKSAFNRFFKKATNLSPSDNVKTLSTEL